MAIFLPNLCFKQNKSTKIKINQTKFVCETKSLFFWVECETIKLDTSYAIISFESFLDLSCVHIYFCKSTSRVAEKTQVQYIKIMYLPAEK